MFENDEPTDDWFDHIGLGDTSDHDGFPAGRNVNTEGVASAIHGAVAMSGFLPRVRGPNTATRIVPRSSGSPRICLVHGRRRQQPSTSRSCAR